MTLVKVYTDVGGVKPVHLIAKIFDAKEATFSIRYLSPTDITEKGKKIYRYEDEVYEIDEDSISEYMNTEDETVLGFEPVQGGFILADSDSDYEPDGDEEDDEDDSSDQDEDEEESWGSDQDDEWSDGADDD
jgi:hypothetical protein